MRSAKRVFLVVFAILSAVMTVFFTVKDIWEIGQIGLPDKAWIGIGLTLFFGCVFGLMTSFHQELDRLKKHGSPGIKNVVKPKVSPAIGCRRCYVDFDGSTKITDAYAVFSNEPAEAAQEAHVGNTMAALTFMPLNEPNSEVFNVVTASWKDNPDYWVNFGLGDINELRVARYTPPNRWRIHRWKKTNRDHRLVTEEFFFDGPLRVRVKFRGNCLDQFVFALVPTQDGRLTMRQLIFIRRSLFRKALDKIGITRSRIL